MDELDRLIAERSDHFFCYEDWAKLHAWCNYGLLECIKTILADEADVNARTPVYGFTPLYIVCHDSSTLECAKLLIAAGADVNLTSEGKGNWTPLHVACSTGLSAEYIKLLLSAGANINVQTDKEGWTPLYLACRFGHVHVAQTLLEAGADPTIRNNLGILPQDITMDKEIKDLINNFGLGGGRSLKATITYE